MTDYLRQLIDDYNDGVVDLSTTLNRLAFLDWKENSKPLPDDYVKVPRDPLDILIEAERHDELMTALRRLREELSPDNWEILVMIADGKTQEKIGERFGISHQAIGKRIGTIRRYAESIYEALHQQPVEYEAGSPTVKVEYPMDAMKKNGTHCRIPEYLDERFPDCNVLCCLCNKCQRKSMNH